jgi:hypothetical protein
VRNAFASIQAQIPGWKPYDGHLEVAELEETAQMASESAQVASQMSVVIFMAFGVLIGILPEPGTQATVPASFTMNDTAGYTIPSGTQIGYPLSGNSQLNFTVQATIVVPPGQSTGVGTLVCETPGAFGNGLAPATCQVISPTNPGIASVATTAVSAGGTDAETQTAYINRLSAELQLLAPRPILAADYAAMAPNVPGVFRALAIDGLNPGRTFTDGTTTSGSPTLVSLLQPPLIPTVTPTGTPGVTTWSYVVTAVNPNGETTASPVGTTATGAATLNTTNYNALGWTADPDAASYNIYRYNGTVYQLIGNSLTNSYHDTGAAAGTINPPVTNTATSAAFDVNDLHKPITRVGSGIPASTYVGVINDPTSIGLSSSATSNVPVNASVTGSGITVTLGDLTNQERFVAVCGIDSTGAALADSVSDAMYAYFQAKREVNFVVAELSPTFSGIDVTVSCDAIHGANTTTVQSAIVAALNAFLNPATWGGGTTVPPTWSNTAGTVRFFDVVNVVRSLPQVAFINDAGVKICIHGGTLAELDVVLPGDAPLPSLATVSVTVAAT